MRLRCISLTSIGLCQHNPLVRERPNTPSTQRGGKKLKRNLKITFRVNEKERSNLQKQVEKSGLSQETYIRTVLSGHVPKESPPVEYFQMIRELNAIGKNLHQISARANATGFILADQYEDNYTKLMEKVLAIQEAVMLPEVIRGYDENLEG